MQPLNVLVVGEGRTLPLLGQSKFLNKLYLASNSEFSGAISINFNTFRELAVKCKALKVDIVIVEDEKLIQHGITDVLRKNLVNVFAPYSINCELFSYNSSCKIKLAKYGIKTPKTMLYPASFPIRVRADGINQVAYNMEELIKIREEINSFPLSVIESTCIEEYLGCENLELVSLFDGKTLLSFYPNNLEEAQKTKLQEYSQKLQNLFISEKYDFIGFVSSKLIWFENNWYNQGFGIGFPKPEIDFIYLLLSAIYQKLDEISP